MVRVRDLMKAYRVDPRRVIGDIREALERGRQGKSGGLRPDDFSIRDLAADCIIDEQGEPIGLRALESLCRSDLLLESDAALNTSIFATLTRQILNAAVMEGYQLPSFVLSAAIPSMSGNVRQARLTGVSLPLKEDKTLEVQEGQEYPSVGMYEEYVKTPTTVKRGAVLPITKEIVLADETGQIVDQARRIGEFIGLQKELALTDYVIGAVANCVVEKRVGDSDEVTSNLFLSSGRWVNVQTVVLEDWTDIDAAENLLAAITMPGTEQPVMLIERTLLVPSQLRNTAARILNATETRSGTSNVIVAANPLSSLNIQMIASPLVYSRLVAAGTSGSVASGTWFYGDLRRAFRYYQNWPLTVEEDRTGGVAFTHDILVRFKASERGTPVVVEPRFWSKQNPS